MGATPPTPAERRTRLTRLRRGRKEGCSATGRAAATTTSASLLPLLAALVPLLYASAEAALCSDLTPDRHSCARQKEWGKCKESWFVEGEYCRKTCGECKATENLPREVQEAAEACALGEEIRGDMMQKFDLLMAEDGHEKDSPKFRLFEQRGAIQDAIVSDAFLQYLEDVKLDCLVTNLSEDAVHEILEKLLKREELEVPKKMAELFSPENAARILTDFFSKGCTNDQFILLLPPIMDALQLPDSDVLLGIYSATAQHAEKNATLTYTGSYEGNPSASTCFGANLNTLLSVRSCRDYNCYN